MKAYNTPKDELHIESDTGETLVSITPEKTTIANLESGGTGKICVITDNSGSITCNYSFNELKNALSDYIFVIDIDYIVYYPYVAYFDDRNNAIIVRCLSDDLGGIGNYTINSNNSITFSTMATNIILT